MSPEQFEDFRQLRKSAHALARKTGWWDNPRTHEEIAALLHSEISEAFEAWRSNGTGGWVGDLGKPEGFVVELADLIIRVADYYEGIQHFDENISFSVTDEYLPAFETVPELIARLHSYVSEFTNSRHVSYLGVTVGVAVAFCLRNNLPIQTDIEVKHRFNQTRPYRHGGKRA